MRTSGTENDGAKLLFHHLGQRGPQDLPGARLPTVGDEKGECGGSAPQRSGKSLGTWRRQHHVVCCAKGFQADDAAGYRPRTREP